MEEIEAAVLDADGQVTPLMSSAPIHSALMAEDAQQLGQELEKYAYNIFKWPVLSNVTGQPYGDVDRIPKLLTEQMVKPVQWTRILQYLERFGVTLAIEMGPKNVLNKLTKTNCPDMQSLCFGEKAERQKLISMFQTEAKHKKEFRQSLPNAWLLPWQRRIKIGMKQSISKVLFSVTNKFRTFRSKLKIQETSRQRSR